MSAILGNGTITFGDGSVQTTAASAASGPSKLMDTSQQNGAYRHAFVIMSDGSIKAWGFNQTYTLGTGSTGYDTNLPMSVAFPSSFPGASSVYSNRVLSAFCIDTNGQLWSWGRNDYGSCGVGNASVVPIPINVSLLSSGSIYGKTVTKVFVPSGTEEVDFVMVLCSDGTLHASGYNAYGQIGDGTTTNRSYFTRCGTLTGVTDASCGRERYTSCMAIASGQLYNWGYNGDGELGTGGTTSSSTPTLRTSGSLSGKTITKVTNGYLTQFALASDGTLHGWGNQGYGELGVGNRSAQYTPLQINTNVKSVSAGGYTYPITVIIKNDNTVYYAGYEGYLLPLTYNAQYYTHTYDGYGNITSTSGPYDNWQYGSGNALITNYWYALTGFSGTPSKVAHVGTGSYNAIYLLTTEGYLWSWGYNGNGNLGVGQFSQRSLTSIAYAPSYQSGCTLGADGVNYVQPQGSYPCGPLRVPCPLVSDFATYSEDSTGNLLILTRNGKVMAAGSGSNYALPGFLGNTAWTPQPIIGL